MDDLQTYVRKAQAALRKVTQDDDATYRARRAALTRVWQNHDILTECRDLGVDLVEIASAIAYAEILAETRRLAIQRAGVPVAEQIRRAIDAALGIKPPARGRT